MLILIFNNLSVNSVKALQQQIRSIIAEAVKAIADILFSTKNLTRFVQQRIWGWCWSPVQMVASDNIPDWHYTRWMLNMHFSEEGIISGFLCWQSAAAQMKQDIFWEYEADLLFNSVAKSGGVAKIATNDCCWCSCHLKTCTNSPMIITMIIVSMTIVSMIIMIIKSMIIMIISV